MKKVILLFAFLVIHYAGFSQADNSAPAGFQYQAVIRDGSGDIMSEEDVTMRFSILSGSASGTEEYVETQSTTTNAFGLVALSIGEGKVVSGTFGSIDWSSDAHFIMVEVNFGSGFEDFGTTELLSVPYALYGEDADADATNEIQDISLDGTELTISGGSTVDLGVLEGVDTQLSEEEVDDYVSNNGYLTTSPFTNNSDVVSGGDTDDDFVFGSTQLADDNSTTDDNARMYFDKSKSAFRVGRADGSQWDDANVGDQSVAIGTDSQADNSAAIAIGYGTTSSGVGSVALGFTTTASTDYAFAVGNYSIAGGVSSVALGDYANASGYAAVAIGEGAKAPGNQEVALGAYNTDYTPAGDDTDRAFVIGNGSGSGSESDAFTVYKSGNALLDGNLSLSEPTADEHAATKKYVDDNSSDDQDLSLNTNILSLTNDVTTVDLSGYLDNTDAQNLSNVLGQGADANATAITNLADPTNDQDAATKVYVDNAIDNIEDYDAIGNLDFKVLGYGEAADVDFDYGAGDSPSGPNSRVGQSFKPTVSGGLTRVAFKVVFSSTSGNEFVLYEGSGFGGSELARIPFTPAGTSLRLVDITFSSEIEVTAGSSYTVAVEGTNVQLSLTVGNPYSAGTSYYGSSNGGTTWDITALTTYMSFRNTPQTAISANEVSVGIGTDTPDTSAALEVSSTTGGLLMPRMTTTERDAISSPADGLMIYNTTTSKFQGRAGGAWVDLH